MDLGIAGRKAIVCASSKGLGRACAESLAEAGCEVVINGRDAAGLEKVAAEIRAATGGKVKAVAADVATPEGQAALLAACPEPDILVNNNAGPAFRDFRELSREDMIKGVIANMIVAVELVQKVVDPMVARKFGRIVNITSGSVRLPLAGLDLSSGARAGLTAFMAGVSRSVAHANVTINSLQPASSTPTGGAAACKGARRSKAPASIRSAPRASMRCRRSASATRPSSARPAPSCARRMPATSLARAC
jgi:3-oxoacyl-[acyl-carrier protein] reductase